MHESNKLNKGNVSRFVLMYKICDKMYKWVWHIVALLTQVLNDTDQTVHIFGILSVKRQTLASLKQYFLPLNGFKKQNSVNCTFLRLKKKKINKKNI